MFWRLFVGSLICLVLSFSVLLMLNSVGGRLLCQLLCFSAAFSIFIQKAWKAGESDQNRVANGTSKEDMLKGCKAGFLAISPFIILAVLLLLSRLGAISYNFLYIYRLTNPIFMPISYSLLPPSQFLNEIPIINVAVCLILPLLFPLLSGLSYICGYRGITLRSLVKK